MGNFTQKLTENSYSRETEIVFSDCDRNKRMRISAMLARATIFAGHDYDARGLTYTVLFKKREVFLLSRLALHIHRCPVLRDILNITIWENGVRGAHMQRVYKFRTRSGELCISAKSDWILMDPVSRKILRPGTFTALAVF